MSNNSWGKNKTIIANYWGIYIISIYLIICVKHTILTQRMVAGTRSQGPGWQRLLWSPHQSFSGSWSLPFWQLAAVETQWTECSAALQVTFFSSKTTEQQEWSRPFGVNRNIFIILVMRKNRFKCQETEEHAHRVKVGGHLSLRDLAGIRTRAVVVRRPALTRSADIHKLIRPHRVDEVTQVFVVKVARQEAWHVDLNKCKAGRTLLENNELPDVFPSTSHKDLFLTFMC